MCRPGIEPGTSRVLGGRDNHYTNDTYLLSIFVFIIYRLTNYLLTN